MDTGNSAMLPEQALEAAQAVIGICSQAWGKGLLAGFNGNVSCLLPQPYRGKKAVLITRSGSVKGCLTYQDLTLLDLDTGETLLGGRPSTEAGMHLEIYRNCAESRAVMHTHPPHLLALSMLAPFEERLALPLFEAETYRKILGAAGAHAPGSDLLTRDVAGKAREYRAVWMEKHGLTTHGALLQECLALSEELEQLAKIQLLTMQAGR